ncbi:MAG: polyisoprenoid-binding protein [Phycisphaerae bacterium]|nr:MAG: polyisoprenoid-binding protein [Phycisphaerae bacterium]
MSHRSRAWITVSSLVLAAGVGVGGLALLPAPAPAPTTSAAAGAWTVDPVHSFVVFKIRHNGAGNAYGMIHNPAGTFTIDPAKPEASSIEVTLQAEKVSTGNDGRDKHIRNPDFFNAKEYPTMKFTSTAFKSAGENAFDVTGNLTFLGQTRPITARLVTLGTGQGRGGPVMGVEATFTIKRSDFGNKTMIGPLGDEVAITVALEAGQQ